MSKVCGETDDVREVCAECIERARAREAIVFGRSGGDDEGAAGTVKNAVFWIAKGECPVLIEVAKGGVDFGKLAGVGNLKVEGLTMAGIFSACPEPTGNFEFEEVISGF